MERLGVCVERQEVCLYGTAGSVFLWKDRKCFSMERQEVCVCMEKQEVCLYRKVGSMFV